LGGVESWWEHRDNGKMRVVMPGEAEVDEITGKVGNGEFWALRGVINYA
jgi:hypothetical protein